jgi:hypothetical protein
MTQPLEPDPLPSTLRAFEAELSQRLGEACEKVHVSEESTGELMRLEETLLDAARVAKQAVSVRRKLRTRREAERDSKRDAERQARLASAAAAMASGADGHAGSDGANDASSVDVAPADVAVRNLVDPAGVEWQIWEVTPSRASRTGALLSAYRDGWLAFESVDGSRHRRLPGFPRDWTRLTNLELEKLLARAEEVRRKRRTSGPTTVVPDESV